MKQFLFLAGLALIAATSTLSAQTGEQQKTEIDYNPFHKPKAGSVSTEIQFNPFDQNGKTFSLDGLKLRYFLTGRDALRLKIGFGVNHDRTQENYIDEETGYIYNNKFKYKTGSFSLNTGYERHFYVANRADVYIGGTFGFTRSFSSTHIDVNQKTDQHLQFAGSLTNAVITEWPTDGNFDESNIKDRAYWAVDAAAVAGLDFYLYKGLYIGTELGFGISTRKYCPVKFAYQQLQPTEDVQQVESHDNTISVNAKFYVEPVLRLGWTF